MSTPCGKGMGGKPGFFLAIDPLPSSSISGLLQRFWGRILKFSPKGFDRWRKSLLRTGWMRGGGDWGVRALIPIVSVLVITK